MQDETLIKIYYCPECYRMLESLGYPAQAYYEVISETCIVFDSSFKFLPHSKLKQIGKLDFVEIENHPRNKYDMIIELLEEKGFISTTDIFDDVFLDIVPNGLYYEENNFYICIDESHKEKGGFEAS